MRLVSFDLEGLKKEAALIAKQFGLYDEHVGDFSLGYNHGLRVVLHGDPTSLLAGRLTHLYPWQHLL